MPVGRAGCLSVLGFVVMVFFPLIANGNGVAPEIRPAIPTPQHPNAAGPSGAPEPLNYSEFGLALCFLRWEELSKKVLTPRRAERFIHSVCWISC